MRITSEIAKLIWIYIMIIIYDALNKAKIRIPFPTRPVYLKKR